VLNQKLFGTTLRCRWPWLRWASEPRPWALILAEDDLEALAIFRAATFIHIGDGTRALFWTDAWLPGGKSVQDVVPILHSFVKKSNIIVAAALQNNRWVRDITGGLSSPALAQYLQLWDLLEGTTLTVGQQDEVVWRPSHDGAFSVNSAYKLFFIANMQFACAKPIWKSKAPMRCRFFMWLVVHKRCLTADNLARRGWPHNTFCPLCTIANENGIHLFLHCRFSKQVWERVRTWSRANFPIPDDTFGNTEEWWLMARKRAPKNICRDFDTVAILVHWRIWKERNSRIFQQECSTADRVFELIIEDIHSWKAAGCIFEF
jgi:hypothetical protein